MAEPAWAAFAGIAAFVTLTLVALARVSQQLIVDGEPDDALPPDSWPGEVTPPESRPVEAAPSVESGGVAADDERSPGPGPHVPASVLLVNVALSQGLLLSLLVLGAWFTRIPARALGLGGPATDPAAVAVGAAVGVALYAGDELLAAVAGRAGIDYSEALRERLAPTSAREWAVLLGGVLPVIAGFEELLFRATLVGAMAAGFGVSPWLLAVGSSVVFGFAHGAQGAGGMAVTGLLGFALAAAFVATGSFVVVFVAHYVVNALEFGVHEGLGVEWTR